MKKKRKKKPIIKKVKVEMMCNCLKGDKSCKLCNGTGKRVVYQYIFVDSNTNIAIDGDALK